MSILPVYVCLVTQSYLIVSNPVDCSRPGSSVRGILQARMLEQIVISSSRGSSPRQGSNPQLLCLLHLQAILYR